MSQFVCVCVSHQHCINTLSDDADNAFRESTRLKQSFCNWSSNYSEDSSEFLLKVFVSKITFIAEQVFIFKFRLIKIIDKQDFSLEFSLKLLPSKSLSSFLCDSKFLSCKFLVSFIQSCCSARFFCLFKSKVFS